MLIWPLNPPPLRIRFRGNLACLRGIPVPSPEQCGISRSFVKLRFEWRCATRLCCTPNFFFFFFINCVGACARACVASSNCCGCQSGLWVESWSNAVGRSCLFESIRLHRSCPDCGSCLVCKCVHVCPRGRRRMFTGGCFGTTGGISKQTVTQRSYKNENRRLCVCVCVRTYFKTVKLSI